MLENEVPAESILYFNLTNAHGDDGASQQKLALLALLASGVTVTLVAFGQGSAVVNDPPACQLTTVPSCYQILK